MAQSSWPFENIDTSESQFSQWARNFQDTGVKGYPGDAHLAVTGDDSGLQVRVSAGQAFVRGHYYDNSVQATVTLDSPGTNTRIDAIVLELDPAMNQIILKAVQGEPVPADPVAPTLTQTDVGVYQMALAYITLPNAITSIVPSHVVDRRVFMGGRIGVWTTNTRPTVVTTNVTVGYNVDLAYHEVWDGTTWVRWIPIPETPDTTSAALMLMGG